MTREHLIPSWYIQSQDLSEGKKFFLEKAPSKFLQSDPVIKDVCGECNNVKLGILDDYAKSLYTNIFFEDIYFGERKSVQFDYDLLLRWLLKISYNSARAHASNPEVLAAYGLQMLGEEALSTDLMIFMMAVSPTAYGEDELRLARRNELGETVEPRWFRFGAFGISGSNWFNWIFRHVLINGYCFFIAIPKKGTEFAKEREALKADLKKKGYGTLLKPNGSKLPKPKQHAIGFFAGHVLNYPVAYGLPQSDHVRDVVSSNYGLLNFQIDRRDIEACDISPYVSWIDDFLGTRESFAKCMGRVEFSVDGYNDDPRELWEIQEVRDFLTKLDSARPYWAVLQSPHGIWLQCLVVCLVTIEKSDKGTELMHPAEVADLAARWYEALNEISNRYSLSDSLNKELSLRVRSLVMSLEGG
jgi:hypothetical protein